MALKFNQICRLCMVEHEEMLLPLFDDNNLPGKINVLIPNLEVSKL